MKTPLLIIFTLLIFNCQFSFGQFYYGTFPVTKDVISIIEDSGKKSLFGAREKFITNYENGKRVSWQKYKGKKLLDEETLEITWDGQKETITNHSRNTTTINEYDEKERLLQSTLYSNGLESPNYKQHDFEYQEDGKLASYKITSYNEGYDEVTEHAYIEYKGENFSKRRSRTDYELGGRAIFMITESIIESFPNSNEVIATNYIYDNQRAIMIPPNAWIENVSIEVDGQLQTVQKQVSKFKHIFDDRGNWIEFYTINQKGKAKLKSKRIITYKN